MVLAQDTEVLLLDEPTTYLGLAHQLEVLDLLAELNERDGRTIVLVLHDLNQACRYAHHLVAMRDGRVYAAGDPREVVDAELVHAVLNLRAEILDDPVSGAPLCIPLGRASRARA
jgi:iron complex transport system ATP-binding protein